MNNMREIAVWLLCCWGCGALFDIIAMFAAKKKTPIHFWSGTKVEVKEVTNVTDYNKANAKMWLVYSLPYWAAGFLGLFHVTAGGVLIGLACIPGLIFLILYYKQKIEKRYFVKYQSHKERKRHGKEGSHQ